jgi:hypothetical protein
VYGVEVRMDNNCHHEDAGVQREAEDVKATTVTQFDIIVIKSATPCLQPTFCNPLSATHCKPFATTNTIRPARSSQVPNQDGRAGMARLTLRPGASWKDLDFDVLWGELAAQLPPYAR